MKILVTFIGHINERHRPEGFPKQVESRLWIHDPPDMAYIQNSVNHYAGIMAAQQFMLVEKEEKDIPIVIGNPAWLQKSDKRYVVPMHMITHIETLTQAIEEPENPAEKVMLQ